MRPTVGEPFAAGPEVYVIPTYWPLSETSVLPINAFLLRAAEPVLIDTGAGALADDFLDALTSLLPLDRLRWLWVTHEDLDHIGSLTRLLDLAPSAVLVASSSTLKRITFERPFPGDRVRAIESGETLRVGDRTLGAVQPPLFDSPATIGAWDRRSGTLFSSDCFGAALPSMDEARAQSIAELSEQAVAENQLSWAHTESPWVTLVDPDAFAQGLHRVRRLEPTAILSSHLPPIHAPQVDRVIATLREAARAEPAAGLTQPQLAALLARFEPRQSGGGCLAPSS